MIIKFDHLNKISSSEITPESVYRERRKFMYSAGALGLGMVAGGWLDTVAAKPKFDFTGLKQSNYSTDEKTTPYEKITTYNNFYELGTDKSDPAKYSKELITDPWSIKVDGHCAKPATLTLEDFMKGHQLEERIYRLRCVEGWSMVIPWTGFSLGNALKRFQPTSKAKYVAFQAINDPVNLRGQRKSGVQWPYVEGLRLDEAMHPLTLLAVGLYGKNLPNQSGAPIRLVVPWKYGFKSIKSIVKITFTEKIPPTAWNLAQPSEYGFYSNVNPEVPHPRWSQGRERRIGELRKRKTQKFNGYEEQVASLYPSMDLKKYF